MRQLLSNTLLIVAMLAAQLSVAAQMRQGYVYIANCQGNLISPSADGKAVLTTPQKAARLYAKAVSGGYYELLCGNDRLTLSDKDGYTMLFSKAGGGDAALFKAEKADDGMTRLRCKKNGKCLGTDSFGNGAQLYGDKNGADDRHLWAVLKSADEQLPNPVRTYRLDFADKAQEFRGWGISLCWWAAMCGKWDEKRIDQLVDWLVSPDGLNYRFFRYNIGGGEDPHNRGCEPHHMGKGKGLRAEMEGFKDSTNDVYHWYRDDAQRKILLKIKERRPDAVFEAFSNSCPWYMTYSGCVGGNTPGGKDNLRPEYYDEFAHYLVDVCRYYKDAYGVEFKTLEPFNESMTAYWYAGGSQEGCHFDKESQVAFIKKLYPVLKASGLNTVISASDETSVRQSVEAFEYYKSQGVLGMVGQWNTHTYIADNDSREQLSQLTTEAHIPLWMSEVGSGGNGIAGNLRLAQTLIDDMRYLRPEAWVDWQYVEEHNDQWCLVQGDFAKQTYHRVKNYYVRQQFSRFITDGYTIINTPCRQTLAAVSGDGKTCVVVVLNPLNRSTRHNIDLSAVKAFAKMGTAAKQKAVKAWRTSQDEDMAVTTGYTVRGNTIAYDLPGLSITTFVVSL